MQNRADILLLNSPQELELLVFPDSNDLFAAYGLTDDCKASLRPAYWAYGPKQVLYALELARQLGISKFNISRWDMDWSADESALLLCKDNWLALMPESSITAQGLTVNSFAGQIAVYPACLSQHHYKLDDFRKVVAIRLPNADENLIKESDSRFYLSRDGIVRSYMERFVNSLYVDCVLGSFTFDELKSISKYSDMPHVIILANESYAGSLIQKEGLKELFIQYPSSCIQRIHDDYGRAAANTFVTALEKHDYQPLHDEGSKDNSGLGYRSRNLAEGSTEISATFNNLLRERKLPDIIKVVEKLKKLFPNEYLDQLQYIPIPDRINAFPAFKFDGIKFDTLENGFEITPQIQIPPSSIEGMDAELCNLHKEMVEPFAKTNPDMEYFTFFSRGLEHGQFGEWIDAYKGKEGIELLHIKDQDRHPLILLRSPDGDSFHSIGIKGGGLRIMNKPGEMVPSDHPGLRGPVYQRKPAIEGRVITTHKYWGGLIREHAEAEFVHTVALHQLWRQNKEGQPAPFPTPLDIGIPSMIPVWGKRKTQWLSYKEYQEQFLKTDASQPFQEMSTYRSMSNCDVRWSTVLNTLFFNPSGYSTITEMNVRLVSVLRLIYAANGKEFRFPRCQMDPSRGNISFSDIGAYLSHIAFENGTSATSLYETIEQRLVSALSLIHHAGGHLGGGDIGSGFGAISGGATALRNIDITGTYHDLDQDIFLPWVRPIGTTLEKRALNRQYLPDMQRVDCLLLDNTLDWVRFMLLGTEEGVSQDRDVRIHTHLLGKYIKLQSFTELAQTPESLSKFHGQLLKAPQIDWSSNQRKRLYYSY